MASWIKRTEAGIQTAPATPTTPKQKKRTSMRPRDPNALENYLDVESTCIYERRLPGNAYITAHVTRLQAGFYDSPSTHGEKIDAVRFLAVQFVFHPSESINRFRAATITVSLHDDTNHAFSDPPPIANRLSVQGPPVPRQKPKFLQISPHLIFGKVSPETLDWNFNLTGSLGVSQTPVSAYLMPSGGMKGSYKLYQMMRIQGSTRTLRRNPFIDSTYDIEDGEAVWTLEENPLQKSGLPREMTFVMLITKGDVENIVFDVNIEPKIAAWFGHYPKFWTNFSKFQPLQKDHVDLDREIGQRFAPEVPGKGFNFAGLLNDFRDFVSLPGATFSTHDPTMDPATIAALQDPQSAQEDVVPELPQTIQRIKSPKALMHPSSLGHIRSASVPPQQVARNSQVSSDGPMDYHIFLHNPRSINLHPTPPPPSHSAPAAAPPSWSIDNPLHATDPIQRPRTTVPDRTFSPANTKMKRRSIEITNLGRTSVSPAPSNKALANHRRKFSESSLRQISDQGDHRISPLIEDSSSETTGISTLDSPNLKSLSPPIMQEQIPKIQSPPIGALEDEILIPMQAPSPPTSTKMLSPPLPMWRGPPSTLKENKLPFELKKPVRPSMAPQRSSSGSGRQGRSRGSPSPMRAQREVTPSPGEEPTSLKFSPSPDQSRESIGSQRLAPEAPRREREISPYAAAALANGVGLKQNHDGPWNESRGDLKELRARKRYSVPASYSYITADADADRDWDER